MATVLVIGGGGREHAIATSLASSAHVELIVVIPGNAGTARMEKARNLSVNVSDHEAVLGVCRNWKVELVVVGSEEQLADGIANYLEAVGIQVFGPTKEAAQIECSKAFAKDFMHRGEIPTADYRVFTNYSAAEEFIDGCSWKGFVIKASGLIGGKGVTVATEKEKAKEVLRDYKSNKSEKFKKAAATFIVEEMLTGYEISVLAFTDGRKIALMPPAQDHKRRFPGDLGPNTGGMGAICPCPLVSERDIEIIKSTIMQRTIDQLRNEGNPFVGILYAGIMMTSDGPKVLEFNCRFGDPETQALLLILKSDLFNVMKSCVDGFLNENLVYFAPDLFGAAVSVVIENYPGDVTNGLNQRIIGIGESIKENNTMIFMAGSEEEAATQFYVTTGGRVLTVCATGKSLEEAVYKALRGAAVISFEDAPRGYRADFRGDIGFKTILSLAKRKSSNLTYRNSGVNIDIANTLVEKIGNIVDGTKRAGVKSDLKMFGAIFDPKAEGYEDPLLVSGTDGVGTKLRIAKDFDVHNTIGIDLVAMCVNDILVHAAEPLYFLDYIATDKLDVTLMSEVIRGITKGCLYAKCALVGGETAEMPGLYREGDYDLAGFAVGAVEKEHLLPKKEEMQPGDVLIGIASSGFHSNGFSLIRKVVERLDLKYTDPAPFFPINTLGEELLTSSLIYTPLLKLLRGGKVLGAAHITGGGIKENLLRIIPPKLAIKIDKIWPIPIVYAWLAGIGIETEEMLRTFNLGVGFILVVKSGSENDVLQTIKEAFAGISLDSTTIYPANEMRDIQPFSSWIIGRLINKSQDAEQFKIEGIEEALIRNAAVLSSTFRNCFRFRPRRKVAVLISGTGTNLQALIDHTLSGPSEAEICLVISNVVGVMGLERAKDANIPTKVIPHRFLTRKEFENKIQEALSEYEVEIVCLAGFMRILTSDFVRAWRGRILNIHPSLLPSFKGINAQKRALTAGVTITGCTVHFVEEEVDGGAIITQESVPVLPGDNEEILSERIKEAEHVAFPRALELVVREKVWLNQHGKCSRI